MVVYVNTQGARIIREGRHLIVKKDGDIHHTLFIYKLQQLIIMGNVIITPPAMKLLLRESIDTVFLRLDGRYLGRLAGGEHRNVFLRKRQFELSSDESFCLGAAKSIVIGKLTNMVTVLQRISRTRHAPQASNGVEAIRRIMAKVYQAENLDILRGYEGSASAAYFPALRHGLDLDYGFTRRVRRPPTDPVNSVLSLLYTFIINRAYSAVRIAGLDPYPGMLHALDYGRHSLPLDLVEEFRPMIADTLTLALFNLGILKEGDFYRVNPPPPEPEPAVEHDPTMDVCNDPLGLMTPMDDDDDIFDMPVQSVEADEEKEITDSGGKVAVKLYSDAFRRVIKAFENKMNTEFYHPVAEKRMTYGEAFIFQARQLRRLIEGEIAHYQPLLLK